METAREASLGMAAASGDPRAAEKLFEVYFPRFTAFSLRQGRPSSEARSLVAEIAEAFFASLDGYRGQVPLPAWALAVAQLVARRRGLSPGGPAHAARGVSEADPLR